MLNHLDLSTNKTISHIITAICAIALITEIFFFIYHPISTQQTIFLLLFTLITLFFLRQIQYEFMTFFLLSTFTLIICWRLAALAQYLILTWIFTLAMAFKIANYILFALESIKEKVSPSIQHHQITRFEWQLLFIRLFIGFDLIPHFCEKLFAGQLIRAEDVQAFTQLGVPHASGFVIIAGLIEFAGALSLSCGFMMRLGSVCLSIYMLVATYLGHHFSKGFIWASKGGGWEYPDLWTVLILTFAVFGAGDFSIDRYLKDKYTLPAWLRHSLGGKHS